MSAGLVILRECWRCEFVHPRLSDMCGILGGMTFGEIDELFQTGLTTSSLILTGLGVDAGVALLVHSFQLS